MNVITIRNYKIIQLLAPCMKMVCKGSLIHVPSGTVDLCEEKFTFLKNPSMT